MSEEHVHTGVGGGPFPSLGPRSACGSFHREGFGCGGVSAPGLVGFASQGQGHNDQVAGGALNQGRRMRWLRLGR